MRHNNYNDKSNACHTMTSFLSGPVTSISKKVQVGNVKAMYHEILLRSFLFINVWLLISCDIGIYAIMLFTIISMTDRCSLQKRLFIKINSSGLPDQHAKHLYKAKAKVIYWVFPCVTVGIACWKTDSN